MDEERRAELLETLTQVERRYVSLLAQYTGSTEEMARRALAEATATLKGQTLPGARDAREELLIYVDGASRGNPGEAGAGAVLYDETGRCVGEVSRSLGRTTNNMAEYRSLILALEEALDRKARQVRVFTDSELLAKQMVGAYRVKSPPLRQLFGEAQGLARRFAKFTIHHVAREENRRADALANQAIDEASKEVR